LPAITIPDAAIASVAHQADKQLGCEAVRRHDRLGAAVRCAGEQPKRPFLLGVPPDLSWFTGIARR
jgi:hypothetical protein